MADPNRELSSAVGNVVGTLDIVVPVFNEEAMIPQVLDRFNAVCAAAPPGLSPRVIMVNDGSSDETRPMLDKATLDYEWLTVVHLARNFGHQPAVTAGLDRSESDYVCIIDGDLQDPPELIFEMLAMLVDEQCDVVYGQRTHRQGETRFKLWTASLFYRTLRRASGVEIPLDTGDFRVMTRRMNLQLRALPEHHRFLRAMIPWVGFPSAPFPYERHARTAGETKYSLGKMFNLASHAMASFSAAPLRLIQTLGLAMCAVGSLVTLVSLFVILFTDARGGLAALAGTVFLTGGIVTTAVAVVGGYVFRVQDEVKGRPLYVVDCVVGSGQVEAW